ncbi:DUF4400 domain-containing protein [Paraburkholderia domus]|uniref:DUF4400 domain-containing protein n=1 Tax=Paraburkholderia domus TaxID=2793075 RepID=UPI00191134AA|nr:DUF4400 domain-containing protein [Paraburkholderia domus]MBK5065776.1 DUF4400 domain-containing protein [Burkholderia sp. R-70199]CAE6962988.1 hypothetical protein R70199_07463 [Paraburkholderia domus]
MSSRFVSHIRWWFFIAPLLALFLMPLLDNEQLFKVYPEETDSVSTLLGPDRADSAIERANADFKSWFVDTGAVRATMDQSDHKDLDDTIGNPVARRWAHNFWFLIYRITYRASVMRVWVLGTILMCVASFIDGGTRRKVNAAAGGVVRPLHFHVAAHGILLVLGVVFTVLMLPMPILAPFWIAVSATLVFLVWRAAASYQ